MSILRTHNLQNPDSSSINIVMDKGGNTNITGVTTVGSNLKVGIGEDSPVSRLHLANSGSGNVSMTITNDTTGHTSGNGVEIGMGGEEQAQIWNYENSYFRVGTNNQEKLRITSDGKLGLGEVSPGFRFHGKETGGPNIVGLFETSQTDAFISFKASGTTATSTVRIGALGDDFVAYVNGGYRLSVKSNGNIGVGGLTNPGALLSIPAGESNTPRLAIESAVDDNDFTITQYEDGNGTYTMLGQNVKLNSGGNNTVLDSAHRTAGILLDARNHGSVTFLTGGANAVGENVKIDSGGRLLVGTTSLIDSSTASNFQIASASGPRLCIARNNTNVSGGNLMGALDFYGNDSDGNYEICGRMILEADGTHTTDAKPTRMAFYTTPSGSDTATERLRITNAGHVSIVGDNQKLLIGANDDIEIYHDGSASYIHEQGTGDLNLCVGHSGSKFVIQSGLSGNHLAEFNYQGAAELFHNGSQKLTTTSTGLSVTGNIAVSSGNGIDFSANSNASQMSSELLDDYEEGSFTPSISAGYSGVSNASSWAATGYYVKVGQLCHISITMHLNSTGYSSSTRVRIGGFPFIGNSSNNNFSGTLNFGFGNIDLSNYNSLGWYIPNNQAFADLYSMNGNTGYNTYPTGNLSSDWFQISGTYIVD